LAATQVGKFGESNECSSSSEDRNAQNVADEVVVVVVVHAQPYLF